MRRWHSGQAQVGRDLHTILLLLLSGGDLNLGNRWTARQTVVRKTGRRKVDREKKKLC